jgi:hypothetical protein
MEKFKNCTNLAAISDLKVVSMDENDIIKVNQRKNSNQYIFGCYQCYKKYIKLVLKMMA